MHFTINQALVRGIEAQNKSKLKEAERFYRAVLKAEPFNAVANHNLGVLAVSLNQVGSALSLFKTAVEQGHNKEQFWLSYIDALIKDNQFNRASDVIKSATKVGVQKQKLDKLAKKLVPLNLSKGPPREQINRLLSFYRAGHLNNAKKLAATITQEYPKHFFAWKTLGAILSSQGEMKEALNAKQKSVNFAPADAEARRNLGNTLRELGRLEEAINSYTVAIELDPDDADVYGSLSAVLQIIRTDFYSAPLAKVFLDVINLQSECRPIELARSITTLLKLHPLVFDALEAMKQNRLEENILLITKNLATIPLFLKILTLSPIPDLGIECLLSAIRRHLLLFSERIPEKHNIQKFQVSLALQCFTNEFIYEETEEEIIAIKVLEENIERTYRNKLELAFYDILCLASYRPLHKYVWSRNIRIADELKPVLERQVFEVDKEQKFQKNMPILNNISDNVSIAVKTQYEENPYPRWINTRILKKPLTIAETINKLKLKKIDKTYNLPEAPVILIAGCGTGQHSVVTASRFKNSRVTAIDLSLNSLSYAKRKTFELGLKNIEYMQADILDLQKLDRQYDIIESGGVLHHLRNPVEGWKVLADCLKPSGFMKIGLYSKIARQHIKDARKKIVEKNISPQKSEMLQFRKQIINGDKYISSSFTSSNDFFSTSGFRDLLFHVQEHHFTIPQIKQIINELGLTFIGFEFSDTLYLKHFKSKYTSDNCLVDLDIWAEYEIQNSSFFSRMYQFWLQKN